ncbi:MAG TPA: hypothetical protein VKS79_18420 [Gemmataceae bacterium]|nr:hypothetical protein [Gemmataceae bacterium]
MPEPLNDLNRLEADLQRLAPISSRLDRDNLFHTAGQIQGERRLALWKVTSAAFAVLAIGLATGLVFRPVRIDQRVVTVAVPIVVPVTAAAPSSAQPETSASEDSIPYWEPRSAIRSNGLSYQEMRKDGLRFGSEGMMNSVPQYINASAPPVRSVEDDLSLPRGTLPEWKSQQPVQ